MSSMSSSSVHRRHVMLGLVFLGCPSCLSCGATCVEAREIVVSLCKVGLHKIRVPAAAPLVNEGVEDLCLSLTVTTILIPRSASWKFFTLLPMGRQDSALTGSKDGNR